MNLFPEIESFGLTSFNLAFGKHFFKTITLDSQVSSVSGQRVEEERNTPCRSVVVRTPKTEVSSVYEYFFRSARLNISEMSKLYVPNFLLFVEPTVQWTCSFQFSDFPLRRFAQENPLSKVE